MRRERKLFDDDARNGESDPKPPDIRSERSKSQSRGTPHNGTATSREAANRMFTSATAQTVRVLGFIACQGATGATDHEIQAALQLSGDTERPRRWSLLKWGLIRDSGLRRKSPAGRAAVVWVADEAALPPAMVSPKSSQAT